MKMLFDQFEYGIHHVAIGERPSWLIVQSWGELAIAKLGAQILHYQPQGQSAVFWLNDSPQSLQVNKMLVTTSISDRQNSARGGVPICWPWFGVNGLDKAAPNHGFARQAQWQLIYQNIDDNECKLHFEPCEKLVAGVDLRFEVLIKGQHLVMRLVTENNSKNLQHLTQALHSYFFVGDSSKLFIEELKDTMYIDKLDGFREKRQFEPLVDIKSIDNIYQSSQLVRIKDPVLKRQLVIDKENSASTVIWHPGKDHLQFEIKEKQHQFICVEAANTDCDAVALKPKESWILQQSVKIEPLV